MSTTINRAYAWADPLRLREHDPRPIGIIQIGDDQHCTPTNPNSWILQGEPCNTVTPEGIADFQRRLMLTADTAVQQARRINAQALKVWGIDGGGQIDGLGGSLHTNAAGGDEGGGIDRELSVGQCLSQFIKMRPEHLCLHFFDCPNH